MINYIKKLFSDWRTLRLIRKNLNVLDPIQNQDAIQYIVNRYSEKNEKIINDLMMHTFSRELVRGNISPEEYNGYMLCLTHRYMIFQNNRKLVTKPN